MASISQLISEIAHSVGQPNNYALRENIKLLIIHTRAEVIRRSYANHKYIDKALTQRFKVELTNVVDGELDTTELIKYITPFDAKQGDNKYIQLIKRTKSQVPKPVRFTNNLPFDRISSVGYKYNKVIPFIKETSAQFRSYLPGMKGLPSYDYINGYIYIIPADNCKPFELNTIEIESAFETPIDNKGQALDEDDEFVLSEDMIGQIKEIIYKRDLLDRVRESNETTNNIKF